MMNGNFTNDRNIQIGLYIRKLRKMKDWSQEYFAEKIGVSRRTIVRIEKGVAPMDFERIADIAAALEISVHDILNVTQEVV